VSLVARWGARSDIGLHRAGNEDAFVAAPPLFAVCDGMGGAQAGEVASQLACRTLTEREAGGDGLVEAARAANEAVYSAAFGDDRLAGMGTTLTSLRLEGDAARFVHVGDSRAYLLRDGVLRQLTEDHSVVAEMIRGGELTPEEAETHPMRSILTRALGTDPRVRVDELEVELRSGDVLLLCSDGLSGMVDDARIATELTRDDPDESAARLIRAARRAGGHDNITAVVVRLEDEVPVNGGGEAVVAAAADEAETETVELPPVGAGGSPEAGATEASPALEEATPATTSRPGVAAPAQDAPRDPGERRARRRLSVVLAVLVVVLVLGVAAAVVLQAVYFVGVDDGRLAVFSGLPWALGPLKLQSVYLRGLRAYDALPVGQRRIVDQRALRGRDDALDLLESLEEAP
jgi:protein phosphatase